MSNEAMTIYVPRRPGGPGFATLLPGSALVGRPWSDTHTLVYYEGNKYGFANARTFTERVRIAAGRLRENYPTVARMLVPTSELVAVGVVDHDLIRVEIDRPGALQLWLSPRLSTPTARESAQRGTT